MTASDDLRVGTLGFLQPCEVTLWNHKHVSGSFWIDVFKRVDMFVFKDFFRRNLAANDAAEKAIRIAHTGHLPER